jgi:hypothetical protein
MVNQIPKRNILAENPRGEELTIHASLANTIAAVLNQAAVAQPDAVALWRLGKNGAELNV